MYIHIAFDRMHILSDFDYRFPCSTMWMFMLVMMVFTRTRSEDSRVPTNQSMVEGSASAIVPRLNCRRKRNMPNTSATGKL